MLPMVSQVTSGSDAKLSADWRYYLREMKLGIDSCRSFSVQVEGASPPWTPTGFHTAREDLLDSAAAAEEASQGEPPTQFLP